MVSKYECSSKFIGGYLKPHRTDTTNGQALPLDASLRTIIVFVQFPDENPLTDNSYWPIGYPPIIKDSLLAPIRLNSGNYWNTYNEGSQRLSDYYQEVSRGKFHVTGITRHYIFDHNRSWYNATTMNNEVYTKLKADLSINWIDYDKWKYLSPGNYSYEGDGNLDMIMMVRRTNPGDAGFAGLDGIDFEIDPINHIWIRNGFSQNGSGTVQQGNLGNPVQPHSYDRFLGILIHEYGHFLFGPHSDIGIMTSRGGNSIHDLFYSPFEKYKLGYINPKEVVFAENSSYSIGDISCRYTNNEVLKVPINGIEYFLIENRRKISKWDVKMLGDTARLNMSFNSGEYGKGVYIYHHQSINLEYPGGQDQECADGLWNWEISGTAIPDWQVSATLPLLKRFELPSIVKNDDGRWAMLGKDGITANNPGGDAVYFSLGVRNTIVNSSGTDKVYTNFPQYWTSREQWGDRLDAWNIGYNEIFSPCSNPNTKDWANNATGIFIYYNNLNNGIANIKVYKVSSEITELEILALTPPSRPMGIVVDYYLEGENYMRPRITWNHNMEPDMLRTNLKKKYKIWRAKQTSMSYVPTNYTYLDTISIDSGTAPSYIDVSITALGSAWPGMGSTSEYPIRYKVQAIDKYADSSVRSDFGMAIGLIPNIGCSSCADGPDNFINEEGIPIEFNLYNNYPNPFNPSTSIRFDIPSDNFVDIKVYNVLGMEVVTLVNEFRKAGSYVVSFNGANLSSGIYYYKIKSGSQSGAGEFEKVRKMMLIK